MIHKSTKALAVCAICLAAIHSGARPEAISGLVLVDVASTLQPLVPDVETEEQILVSERGQLPYPVEEIATYAPSAQVAAISANEAVRSRNLDEELSRNSAKVERRRSVSRARLAFERSDYGREFLLLPESFSAAFRANPLTGNLPLRIQSDSSDGVPSMPAGWYGVKLVTHEVEKIGKSTFGNAGRKKLRMVVDMSLVDGDGEVFLADSVTESVSCGDFGFKSDLHSLFSKCMESIVEKIGKEVSR